MKRILLPLLVMFMSISALMAKESAEFVIATYLDKYVLDIPEGRFFNGAKVQLWEYYKGSDNQEFRIYQYSEFDTARLIYCSNGFNWALDVPSGKVENGNRIQIWEPYPKSSIQRWRFEKLEDNVYIIHSELDDNYVLTADRFANGASVVLKKYDGSINQKWWIFVVGTKAWEAFNENYGKVK